MGYNNRYQYGTNPRKIEPEYEPMKKKYPKKSTAKKINNKKNNNSNSKEKQSKEKKQKAKQHRVTLYVLIGFVLLFTMSYRNALISQNYSKIKSLETELSAIQKENEQLEVNIETNMNLKNIEKSAKNMLGMQKISEVQTRYVDLPREDYVEPVTEVIQESKEDNWITEIWNMIVEYFNLK